MHNIANPPAPCAGIAIESCMLVLCMGVVGVRGSPERVISSLRAFGSGGGQIRRVVRVSARAPFEVFLQK